MILTDEIRPESGPKQSFSRIFRQILKSVTTREGLLGDYDYVFLFKPNLPFMKKSPQSAPFFGLNARMPLVLSLLLGLQHALAILAGGMC